MSGKIGDILFERLFVCIGMKSHVNASKVPELYRFV